MEIITADGVIRIEKVDVGGTMWANAYLVTCSQTGECVLIDAPGKADLVLEQVRDRNLKYILMTHNHRDHIGALAKLKSTLKVPVYGHADDAAGYPVPLTLELNNADRVAFGKLEAKVLHTPGHTPGSLCFLVGKYLFSGDTIFPGGPGYTVPRLISRKLSIHLPGKSLTFPTRRLFIPVTAMAQCLARRKTSLEFFSRSHTHQACVVM